MIEAVFENRAIKADVTARAEAVIPATAIYASNTSTLPITGLAKASKRPGLPGRAGGQARAQLREQDSKADLKWSGGKAGT